MRGRFGRRRRSGGGDDGSSAIDSGWLQRIVEAGLVPASALEPVLDEAVPPSLALLGRGMDAEGRPVLVVFSPRDGGDALLALMAHRRRERAEPAAPGVEPSPFAPAAAPAASVPGGAPGLLPRQSAGRAFVVSRWSAAARRRLAFVGELDVSVEPVEAGRLLEGPAVHPEPPPPARALPPQQLAATLADPVARELFERALASLAGLAAKHAGGVRGTESGVELVLLARRVARLSVRDGGVFLEAFENRTGPQRLSPASLAEALDQLEGQLRKRLRDGHVLRGEPGLRTAALAALPATLHLRTVVAFPLGGSDGEVLDAVGVAEDGRVVVVAVRERLNLIQIGAILDAWSALQPSLPGLLSGALPPVRLDRPPRLVVASRECEPVAARVIEGLTLELVRLEAHMARDGSVELVPAGTAPASAPAVAERGERGGRRRGRGRRGPRRPFELRDREGGEREGGEPLRGPRPFVAETPALAAGDELDEGEEAEGEPEEPSELEETPGMGRRDEAPEPGPEAPRFERLSAFDLDDSFGLATDETAGGGGGGGGRGRRRGRRRRGRRRDGNGGGSDEGEGPPAPEARRGVPAPERGEPPAELEAGLEAAEEDATAEEEDLALSEAPVVVEEEPVPMREDRPRKAAILAHADRHSLAAAMLLAREARQVEGIWVYPQSELMTFFRSVTTDLRDDVTIFVVGFQASPARDVLQAASLYARRIEWYDTHAWPPEDLAALKSALGDDFVHVRPGLETPLPLVLPRCSRRSRFSDKLVDLVSARFTEHDFQRWGRLWWWRLEDVARRPGDHRNELQPLLTGRPSDLASEAHRAQAPPPPPEVEFVGARDFRIVHFGGYAMVVCEVPPGLDVSMAGRIARERYGAQLSLALREGAGLAVLGATETGAPRPLAVDRMAEHLGEKLGFVETLPGTDHVARFEIRGRDAHPERLEAVVAEIGMGRSILEG